MMKKAFTLVEVSIAGALIGLCILTAVAIIPQGLKAQDVGRMKAAAAATVLYMSANAHAAGKTTCMTAPIVKIYLAAQAPLVPALDAIPANTTRPAPTPDATTGLTLPPAGVDLDIFYATSLYTAYQQSDLRYISSRAIRKAPSTLYQLDPIPPVGDLARRIVFSYEDGDNGDTTPTNTRIIVAWLLSADPVSGRAPMSAHFLGNFVEFRQ